MTEAILQTEFPELKLMARGKVRDIYDLDDALLLVATDRLSAFDVVLPDPIPDKGKVLNQVSLFWFDAMKDLVPNHILATDVANFPQACQPYADQLRHRSMLVKKSQPLAIECVVRGYISGSGWKSYQKDGTVCGIELPGLHGVSSSLNQHFFSGFVTVIFSIINGHFFQGIH